MLVILTVASPSLAAFLSSTLFVKEAHWSCRAGKTNVPQDPSDNLISIIAWKHLLKKDWLSAASSTCHSYEWLGFDVQWVKQTLLRHSDVVIPKHVWTKKKKTPRRQWQLFHQCYKNDVKSLESVTPQWQPDDAKDKLPTPTLMAASMITCIIIF